jgi:hypothetical protein
MHMIRLTMALAVWMSLVSIASASLSIRWETPRFRKDVSEAVPLKAPRRVLEEAARPGTGSEFVVTDRTEILLNGRPCKYAEVPGDATIIHMEVAADQKTVLTIHFRSKK